MRFNDWGKSTKFSIFFPLPGGGVEGKRGKKGEGKATYDLEKGEGARTEAARIWLLAKTKPCSEEKGAKKRRTGSLRIRGGGQL